MSNARAPIVLFVYNRADFTFQTLEHLAANNGAIDSDLVIFSDGPRSSADIPKIAAVRDIASRCKGFRSVKLIPAPENRGLAASIIAGVTAVTEEYGQAIVMEDDIITSRWFLEFLNDGLGVYRDEPKVGSISGYMFPVTAALPETFLLADETCWGWATWKRAWSKFEQDGGKLLSEIQRTGRSREFDLYGAYPFRRMLEDQISGRNSSWAIRWRASLFVNRMLSLYPGASLARNIGTDGSGTHATSADTMFDTVLSQKPITVSGIAIQEDKRVAAALRRYFLTHTGYGLWSRIRRKFRKVLRLALQVW